MKNYYYQLTTNAIFCSESPLIFSKEGSSLPTNGLLSTTGDINKFSVVFNFRLQKEQIVSSWER